MSTQTWRRVKVALISLGVLVALFVALIAAFTYFIAIPRFEEVARTGRVKVAQPTPSNKPISPP